MTVAVRVAGHVGVGVHGGATRVLDVGHTAPPHFSGDVTFTVIV
jgi:hypothetical protein